MKAVIHCGTYKTGSTTIQNTAYHNREILQKNGVLYPKTGIDNSSEKEEVGFRHSRFVYEYGTPSYSRLLQKLDKEISNSKCNTVFLSAEAWSRPLTNNTLPAIVDHLYKTGFTEVRGIVFIRNIRSYMVSHYREWVRRHGAHHPFNRHIVSHKNFFDYLSICNKIKESLHGNVDFFSYEHSGDVNQFIFKQLGVNQGKLKPPSKTNYGLSCIDIEIIRILNQHGIRIKNLPKANTILESFGLSMAEAEFNEKIPVKIMNAFGPEYIEAFSSITGISNSESSRIFEIKKNLKSSNDILKVSPILEKVVFEWLKSQRK